MKQKLEVKHQKSEVKYRANHNAGSVLYLRRIGMSRDDAHASRWFFNQHKHVHAVEGSADIWTVCSVSIIVVVAMALLVLAQLARISVLEKRITGLEQRANLVEVQADQSARRITQSTPAPDANPVPLTPN